MPGQISFSPTRVYLMVRNTLWLKRYKICLVSATVGTLVILIYGVAASRGSGGILHPVLYPLFLYGSGFIVSARAFQELDSIKTAGAWLMLPASTLEKFLSRLFLTSFGYVAGSMLVYFLVTLISKGINQVLFGFSQPLFNPFDPWIRFSAGLYLVLQSMFLAGAAYFRRFACVKTVLFLSLLSLTFLAGFLLMSKWILGQNIQAVLSGDIQHLLLFSAKIGFWGILAPLCYVITYFRLREIEV